MSADSATVTVQAGYKPATLADKQIIRAAFVAGEGSGAELARKHGLSPNTVNRWINEGGWTALRNKREQGLLDALVPSHMKAIEQTQPTTPELRIVQGEIARVADQLADQMEPTERAQLVRALDVFSTEGVSCAANPCQALGGPRRRM
jgi:transposase-like protein